MRRDDLYFVQGPPDGWTKIGRSFDPPSRVQGLQGGCPYPLRLVALSAGEGRLEKYMHGVFQDVRGAGEWFRLNETSLARLLSLGDVRDGIAYLSRSQILGAFPGSRSLARRETDTEDLEENLALERDFQRLCRRLG